MNAFGWYIDGMDGLKCGVSHRVAALGAAGEADAVADAGRVTDEAAVGGCWAIWLPRRLRLLRQLLID